MNKLDKALEVLRNDNVFITSITDRFVYYKVKGSTDKIYDVIYNKAKDEYSCDCKNLRLNNSCYHISACKILAYANETSIQQENY